MPEGPEVWILSKAINKYYNYEKTISYGKHLFLLNKNNEGTNWSFGLTGKVNINENNDLMKVNTGYIYGHVENYNDYTKETEKLGIDWFTCKEEEIKKEVESWKKSRKKIALLLLDQSKISGIGIAWGSEIIFKSRLKPDLPACDQDINNLSNSMIEIRDVIKKVYSEFLNTNDCKYFINEWFHNLYKIRQMNIYKKGSQIKISGRIWWV
jgi:formamidopyrimidine-DNA glycosylase